MRSEDWDQAYESAELTYDVEPHPQVAEALADLPPGRAVELGCGEGRESIWLADRGWLVTAVDFSRVAVERGRRIATRYGVEVDWQVCDVREYQPPVLVDLALVLYLHLGSQELDVVLRRAGGALAPGGTLFVLGWDRSNAATGNGGPRPVDLLYDPDELVKAAEGLQIRRADRIPQVGSPGAVDVLLVADKPT